MLSRHCIVCNDDRKFNRKVDDIRRIVSHMRTMRYDRDINLRREINTNREILKVFSYIKHDKPSVHFMCGRCAKVNEYELNMAFDDFLELYMNIYITLKNTEDEDYFGQTKARLIQVLSGFCPISAREIKKVVFKKEL